MLHWELFNWSKHRRRSTCWGGAVPWRHFQPPIGPTTSNLLQGSPREDTGQHGSSVHLLGRGGYLATFLTLHWTHWGTHTAPGWPLCAIKHVGLQVGLRWAEHRYRHPAKSKTNDFLLLQARLIHYAPHCHTPTYYQSTNHTRTFSDRNQFFEPNIFWISIIVQITL